MVFPFEKLQADYQTSMARMQITRPTAVKTAASRLVGFIDAGRSWLISP